MAIDKKIGNVITDTILVEKIIDAISLSYNWYCFEIMYKVFEVGLGIVASLYFFAYMPMQLVAGLLSDRFGPRRLLTIMIFICAMGALVFSQAHSLWSVALGRVLMGFGSAFAFTGTLVIISRWFATKYFATLTGILQLMSSIGAIIASTPLAIFIANYGWRAAMLYLALLGFILAGLVYRIIRDMPPKATPIKQVQPGELKRLKRVIRNPQTWSIGVYSFLLWAPMIVFGELWGAPYVSAYYAVSIKQASLVIDMLWLGVAISCPLTALLSEYIRQRLVVLKLMTLLGFIVSLLMVLNLHVPFYAMGLLSFLLGCSASGAILTFAMINEINPSSDTGTAIGFNNMMVVAGGALLHPLVGYILKFWWSGQIVNGAPIYSAIEYQHALWVLPLLYVVAGFIVSKKIKDSYTAASPVFVSKANA